MRPGRRTVSRFFRRRASPAHGGPLPARRRAPERPRTRAQHCHSPRFAHRTPWALRPRSAHSVLTSFPQRLFDDDLSPQKPKSLCPPHRSLLDPDHPGPGAHTIAHPAHLRRRPDPPRTIRPLAACAAGRARLPKAKGASNINLQVRERDSSSHSSFFFCVTLSRV